MADDKDKEELDAEGAEQAEGEGGEAGGKKKKGAGLAALLPKLLKFVAIGLGALIFIVTVAVITFNIMAKGGQSQTVVPESSPYIGKKPEYSMFTSIGTVRTRTCDPTPYSVVVDMVVGYDLNDKNAMNELTSRLYELRDFVRSFFSGKTAAELETSNEARLKQEIIEALNTRVLDASKARIILFNQLDVMSMQ